MKTAILTVAAVGIFGFLIFLAFRPSSKPESLGSQIAQTQRVQGTTEQNSQEVKAVDYSLQTFDDTKITFSEVNGQKPVVVQIWATWCEICAREFPENNKIAQKYKDKIDYHAVNIGGADQTPKTIENYVKRMNLDPEAIKFLVDMEAQVSGQYGFKSTPQHLFIKKGGLVNFYKPGYMSPSEMEDQILKLLAV